MIAGDRHTLGGALPSASDQRLCSPNPGLEKLWEKKTAIDDFLYVQAENYGIYANNRHGCRRNDVYEYTYLLRVSTYPPITKADSSLFLGSISWSG